MKRFWFSGELTFAKAGSLSGGERRRLQLLPVLAGRPNVLFLDEPTNDLDLDTLRILKDFLEEWPGALVTVSHDRTFLERTTQRLVTVGTDGAWPGSRRCPGLGAARRGAPAGGSPALHHARHPRCIRRRPANLAVGRRTALRPGGGSSRRREADDPAATAAGQGGGGAHVHLRPSRAARLGDELAAAQGALDEAEERWLALAEEAESRG